LGFEVRNVLVVNERRGQIDPPGSAAFFADLARLRIGLDRDADDEMVLGLVTRWCWVSRALTG
jgi:hypothetical protein